MSDAKYWDIEADYLGGDPNCPRPVPNGTLRVERTGGWRFLSAQAKSQNPMMVGFEEIRWIELTDDEVRAVTYGDQNYLRTLVRGAAGSMIGGSLGGLIGMATGGRNAALLVSASREGFDFTAVFGVYPEAGRVLLGYIQADRRARARAPLPTIDELSARAGAEASERQTDLLKRISAQLDEQTQLLRELLTRLG